MSIRIITLLVLVTVLMGCGASKKAARTDINRDNPEALFRHLITNQVKVKWFSARAKVDFADDNMSLGAVATIRMLKDSLIWVSVRKLGFEVARAQITKDSVYVIDRLNNAYEVFDLSYLERTYSLPASLEVMQAILLGNPVFFTTTGWQSANTKEGLQLNGKNQKMDTSYLLDDKTLALRQMRFEDARSERKVNVKLEEYNQLPDNQKFSYFRIIEMTSRETGKVKAEIRFSQLEINIPKDVRFEIPNRYTRTSYDD
ncbi:MAG TPA: DUF4292 domain-containing protein [Saprospiraceae bacterium]|nr:DUF4292 domain-containing protein [Saprospiraceae bacterium]HMP12334.1 DUF4292 domain-containing protein [Saprospiraceae bacterium]